MADEPTPTPAADPAAPTPTPTGGATPPAGGTPKPDGDEAALGEAGKRALDTERTARKSAEAELAKARTELDEFRQAQMTEQEKAVEAARKAGRDEATSEVNTRLIRAEVTAVAAGKAADPTDVVAILAAQGKLAEFKVAGDGSIDRKPIEAAIDDLLKAKPHLAAVRDPAFGNRQPANGGNGNGNQSMNDWLREQARR